MNRFTKAGSSDKKGALLFLIVIEELRPIFSEKTDEEFPETELVADKGDPAVKTADEDLELGVHRDPAMVGGGLPSRCSPRASLGDNNL